MIKVKHEQLFYEFSDAKVDPSEEGREQFVAFQSQGVKPETPDPYFICLDKGKSKFDFMCSELHQMYYAGEWWGFYTLWNDWTGQRWVLPYLCSWHHDIPEWLSLEDCEFTQWAKRMGNEHMLHRIGALDD